MTMTFLYSLYVRCSLSGVCSPNDCPTEVVRWILRTFPPNNVCVWPWEQLCCRASAQAVCVCELTNYDSCSAAGPHKLHVVLRRGNTAGGLSICQIYNIYTQSIIVYTLILRYFCVTFCVTFAFSLRCVWFWVFFLLYMGQQTETYMIRNAKVTHLRSSPPFISHV